MSKLKTRRLTLPVDPHPGLHVGDCVPFYFCPRSVMLYILHMGNHPELTYKGGQGPIVHLEADLHRTVAWASANNLRWAFSLANAAAVLTEFRADLNDLGEIDWAAVANTDFRSPAVREPKQAELLVESCFAWDLVDRVGVCSQAAGTSALGAIAHASHKPPVQIMPKWYY